MSTRENSVTARLDVRYGEKGNPQVGLIATI